MKHLFYQTKILIILSIAVFFYDDQGEWYEGKITWFNSKMDKLRIYFEEDESDDYMNETEINGMDVILLFFVHIVYII